MSTKGKKDIKEKTKDSKTITIEEQYKKKSLHQHILDLPDTYIGSVENDLLKNIFVFDDAENMIVRRDKHIVLGLYKIFDEILVNAADNTVRDSKCNVIKVNIDKDSGEIQVYNNGSTIPIEIHKDENMYVPEMIFGSLLTSGNYDQKGKIVGGRNGLGSKAANIYSEFFDVEICDPIRKKKYYQRFSNNMFDKSEPKILPVDKNVESYTKITFLPDYKRFGLKHLTEDMVSLMKRRVYDIAGTTNPNVKVYYNDEFLDIQSFHDYIKMFYADEDVNIIYEDVNERWSVGVVFDNQSGFQHMSFVNRISTFQGGTHLNYVVNQIVDQVIDHIQSKHKNLKIKPHQVKENISVFVNAVIEDPAFGSQSKETLTSKASGFNIKCELSEKFIQKICKTGLINEIVQVAQIKQLGELEKSDGKKNVNLKSLTKLDDARLAGTKRSPECRLIVTEGDSAKTFAISGLELIGRDLYGVFPLKGKLLNVRNATPNQLLNNEEIKNLKQIMGLKQNAVYSDTKKLRYGGIIILTDQDQDGSHIKGLLMNFFHYFWPSLIRIEGFIQSIATPIVKAYKVSDTKKANPEIFHTLTEYKKWCDKIGDDVNKKYRIKYFKGLGTSTAQEAKESFNDFENKIINYVWSNNTNLIETKKDIYDEISDDEPSKTGTNNESDNASVSDEVVDKNDPSYQAITLAFAKQRENDRKEWVRQYDSEKIIENNIKKIPIYDFVNKDLIHFSFGDNIRSIPDLIDGLKPSQRKILYGAFKRKLDNDEIKVAQLSGYISEHTGYHHGEASLQGAIINMAQDYCGSNNINLLLPSGNFGTRRMGGKDASSPRYIFTQLTSITRNIFINKDEPVLENVLEEGDVVEPVRYYPIIPMILVNGSEGIGTGFSTNIPPYNPIDIIDNLKKVLKGTPVSKLSELVPWYSGFIGKIEKENQNTYHSKGNVEIINEFTVRITELPIGTWTQTYIDYLSSLIEKEELIHDYENNSGNHKIDIKLYFKNGELQKLIKGGNLEKKLKLITTIKTSNMHVYKNNVITKYSSPNQMLKDYIDIRLDFYAKRKEYYIKVLQNELNLLTYRRKFIMQVLAKEIIIERRKKEQIILDLVKEGYPELSTNINIKPSYDYITSIPLFSLTQEKIDELENDFNEKTKELELYKNTTIQDLWLNELDNLEKAYNKWYTNRVSSQEDKVEKKKKSDSKKSDNKTTTVKEKVNKSKLSVKT
jgi:DNA topoisomerase-2